MAGGLGFEPRLMESESIVLPLDDPPVTRLPEEAGNCIMPTEPACTAEPRQGPGDRNNSI